MVEGEIGRIRWPQVPLLHTIDQHIEGMSMEVWRGSRAPRPHNELPQGDGDTVEETGNGDVLCQQQVPVEYPSIKDVGRIFNISMELTNEIS